MKKTIIYILVITLTVALSACGKKGGISESQIKDAPQITDEDQEVKPIRDFSKETEKDVTSEDEPENTEDNSEGNNPEESDPVDMDYNPEEDPERSGLLLIDKKIHEARTVIGSRCLADVCEDTSFHEGQRAYECALTGVITTYESI